MFISETIQGFQMRVFEMKFLYRIGIMLMKMYTIYLMTSIQNLKALLIGMLH